jgi:PGF-pre-PGF domain-containing protein
MGVSSLHQDSPEEFEEGRYRIEGKVVSTSRVNESLPEGSVLAIYDMERVGDIDYEAVAEEGTGIIETRTDELTTQLRQQVSEGEIEIAVKRTTGTIRSATAGEPATVSFSQSTRGSVAIQQASINVSTQVQGAQVDVAEVASLPSDINQPPGQSLRILNISSSLADSNIENASFQLRISTAAIPDGAEVTVYRFHDGEWNTLETTIVEERGSAVTVRVQTSGFSYFSIGTQTRDSQSSTDDNETTTSTPDGSSSGEDTPTAETESNEEDGTGTETTGESGPGFTVLSVVLALLVFAGWRFRN